MVAKINYTNNHKSGSLNKEKEKEKDNIKVRYNSLEKKIPTNINNTKQVNNNNMNIKKFFNKKNLSKHHQNSDYKLSGLNIFQDNKDMNQNNNNSSNSKKKGGRPLTSNKIR